MLVSCVVEFNRWVKARHVGVARVAVESLVYCDDASRVGHPSVPMVVARTLQRMLGVVRLALALRGLALAHGLGRTDAQPRLFRVLWPRHILRHDAQQRAVGTAVRLRRWQQHLLDIAHSKNENKNRFKWEFLFIVAPSLVWRTVDRKSVV